MNAGPGDSGAGIPGAITGPGAQRTFLPCPPNAPHCHPCGWFAASGQTFPPYGQVLISNGVPITCAPGPSPPPLGWFG